MTRRAVVSWLKLGLILGVSLAAGGCVTLGRSFEADKVKSIAIGKTKQAEIQSLFGDPFRTGVDSGDPTWTYVDYHFGVLGRQKATDLLVKFSGDGTVKSYSFNTTEQ